MKRIRETNVEEERVREDVYVFQTICVCFCDDQEEFDKTFNAFRTKLEKESFESDSEKNKFVQKIFSNEDDDDKRCFLTFHGDLKELALRITDYGLLYTTIDWELRNHKTNLNDSKKIRVSTAPQEYRGNFSTSSESSSASFKIIHMYKNGFYAFMKLKDGSDTADRIDQDGKNISRVFLRDKKKWTRYYCSLIENPKGFDHRIFKHLNSNDRASFVMFCHYLGIEKSF
jgi:hypothetical protein